MGAPFWGMNQAMLTFSQDPSSSSHELSFPFSFQSLKFMSPVMPPSPAFLYYLLICFPKYVSCFDKYLLLSVAANPAPPAVLLLQLPYISLLHPCRGTFWFSVCFIEPFGSRHFGVLLQHPREADGCRRSRFRIRASVSCGHVQSQWGRRVFLACASVHRSGGRPQLSIKIIAGTLGNLCSKMLICKLPSQEQTSRRFWQRAQGSGVVCFEYRLQQGISPRGHTPLIYSEA